MIFTRLKLILLTAAGVLLLALGVRNRRLANKLEDTITEYRQKDTDRALEIRRAAMRARDGHRVRPDPDDDRGYRD